MTVPTAPLNNAGRTIKTVLPTGKLIAQVGWTAFLDFFTGESEAWMDFSHKENKKLDKKMCCGKKSA